MFATALYWALWFCSFVFVLTFWAFVRINKRNAMRLEDTPAPLALPKVSLLIPCRNEADNLKVTLPGFLQSDYPHLEVIILDDQSTDHTVAILKASQEAHPGRLSVLSGAPLPAGHNGKNWACQQLAEAATGDILLFCDADVTVGPRAITQTVSTLQHTGASAVTAVPFQRLGSWAERAIVPLVMHVSTLGFVSLRFAFTSSSPLFTVANGQWFAFRRACYEAIGGHKAVKDAIVEDMALARRVKVHGFRVATVLAFEQLSVRMYKDFGSVWEGFSKNLYGLMGYRPANYAIVFVFACLSMIFPWVLALVFGGAWWLLLALLVLARMELAGLARHPFASIALHPVGTVLLGVLSVDSILRYYQGRLTWKDRELVRPGSTQSDAS